MSEKQRSRFIMRAVMTEYMILMVGALLMYLAQQLWPHRPFLVAVIGGGLLAAACVSNFYYLWHNAITQESPPTNPTAARKRRLRPRSH